MENVKIYLSLTTYPKRYDYLLKSLKSIYEQTAIDRVEKVILNIDDNLTKEDYGRYDELVKSYPKMIIKVCDHKWRSANKLVFAYKEYHDSVIVCFDDDKNYPTKCLEQLLDKWEEHPDCIVAQEINPIQRDGKGNINYLNTIDVMLRQREFGKYLSNGCLFPPNCFTDLLYDYDVFMEITNGNHDELWFWLVSTLNGVQCIGLDFTYSWCLDENVCLDQTDSDLTNINCQQKTIDGYNERINKRFGKELNEIVDAKPVKFFLSHDNILAVLGNIQHINALYGNFKIEMEYDETIVNSWLTILGHYANKMKWRSLIVKRKGE